MLKSVGFYLIRDKWSYEQNMMNKNPRVGIGTLVFNNQGMVLLGKRINAHGEGSWAPPGGHLEFGESFEECAIREVFEETSLKIKNPQFLALTNDVFKDEQKHYLSVFMKADFPIGQETKNLEPHKTKEWTWFSLDHLPSPLFLPLKQLCDQKAYGSLLF